MSSHTGSSAAAGDGGAAGAGTAAAGAGAAGRPSAATEVAFIRVTLLGMSGSGKSSLANVFVNNVFYSAYQPTLEPELYYTTARISSKDERSDFHVLLEIEDTFGADYGVTNSGDSEIKAYYDFWYPQTEQTKSEQDFGKKEMTDEAGHLRSTRHPFSMCKAPISVNEHAKQIYAPLTRNRMAYLIVFDINDRVSFQEATKIHREMCKKLEGQAMRPIVYLVANKIDKDPWSAEFDIVRRSARTYSEDVGVRYVEVSAMQYRGVKKLFRNVLQAVLVDQKLWMPPDFPSAISNDPDAAKCVVQ